MGPLLMRGLALGVSAPVVTHRMVRAVEGIAMERGLRWWPRHPTPFGSGTASPIMREETHHAP